MPNQDVQIVPIIDALALKTVVPNVGVFRLNERAIFEKGRNAAGYPSLNLEVVAV